MSTSKEIDLKLLVEEDNVEGLKDALIGERDVQKKLSALCEATSLDRQTCVAVLLDFDVDPTSQYNGRTALYWAVRANSVLVIKMILEKCSSNLQMISDPTHRLHKRLHSATCMALYEAAAHGQMESVKVLLDHGVDPNQFAYHDHSAVSWSTPLIAACYAYLGQRGELHRFCSTAKLLMERGADVTKASCYRETALHYAVHNKMTDDVIDMLLHNGADVNCHNGAGKTPLTCATEKISTIDLLLKWGADINACDKDGWTALHYVATEGHAATISHLLQSGADPNKIADFSVAPTTALALAIQSECAGSRQVVRTLIQWNCDVNILSYPQTQPDGTPFFMACFYVFDPIMAQMLALGGTSRAVMKNCLDRPPFKSPNSSGELVDPHLWQKLKDSLGSTYSLQHLCRLRIRKCLGHKFMRRSKLPIPTSLISYLSVPELNQF